MTTTNSRFCMGRKNTKKLSKEEKICRGGPTGHIVRELGVRKEEIQRSRNKPLQWKAKVTRDDHICLSKS